MAGGQGGVCCVRRALYGTPGNADGRLDEEGCGWRLTLQDLEVLDVCIFGVDVKFDSGHGHIEEDAVEDLAESGTVARRLVVGSGRCM